MKIQGKLNKDIKTMKQIFNLFHPNAPEISEEAFAKLCKVGSYDWVDISGRIKDYGYIDIMIDNGDDSSGMYGSGWSIKDFEERQPKLRFNIWRGTMDVNYKSEPYGEYCSETREFKSTEQSKLREQYTKILTEAGYKTQSAKEWMDEYYSD